MIQPPPRMSVVTTIPGPLTAGAIRAALQHAPDHATSTVSAGRYYTTITATWTPAGGTSSHLDGCRCMTCLLSLGDEQDPGDTPAPTAETIQPSPREVLGSARYQLGIDDTTADESDDRDRRDAP